MEGVPRIPMLTFPMRRSADTPAFKAKLQKFISVHYGESADSYGKEIHELESLRGSAVHATRDYSGCATLKKYFCQLQFLKSRFPLVEGSPIAVTFSWYDAYSDQVHSWSDIDFEVSCILYNIGALHSEVAGVDSRTTVEDMKNCVTHYQCAAWAFDHLRSNFHKFFTPDISPDLLNIMTNVSLAQAQECVVEKSLVDNRRSVITAKLLLQIVDFYQHALRTVEAIMKDSSQHSDKVIKTIKKWKKLIELKISYYTSLSLLYRGQQAEDQSQFGERVTYYKAAQDGIENSIKLAKTFERTDSIHDTLNFALDVIVAKSTAAQKDNEFIYHEKVPALDAINESLKAVALVKPIPLKMDDPDVSGADIFARLVPIEAHEASSLYSEEKAKLLRTYGQKIEEKNNKLQQTLLALQLEHLKSSPDNGKIPQELVDCCAALSGTPDAVKKLVEVMGVLSGKFHDVYETLKEIKEIFASQEVKEVEYASVMGKRAPSNVLVELRHEAEKYEKAHILAQTSNQTLRDAVDVHSKNLRILMEPLPDLMKRMPSVDKIQSKDMETVDEMKRLAGKVEEMQKQRESLDKELRNAVQSDDITKKLVTTSEGDLEQLFEKEIAKHKKITQFIDQNLLAQENILRALTETNARYSDTRQATMEVVQQRNTLIQNLLSSYEAYDELMGKCQGGVDFYVKLEENINKLLTKLRGVAKVQDEEREDKMYAVHRKSTLQSSFGTTNQPPSSANAHPKLKDYLGNRKNIAESTPVLQTNPNYLPPQQQHQITNQNYPLPTAPIPTNHNYSPQVPTNPNYRTQSPGTQDFTLPQGQTHSNYSNQSQQPSTPQTYSFPTPVIQSYAAQSTNQTYASQNYSSGVDQNYGSQVTGTNQAQSYPSMIPTLNQSYSSQIPTASQTFPEVNPNYASHVPSVNQNYSTHATPQNPNYTPQGPTVPAVNQNFTPQNSVAIQNYSTQIPQMADPHYSSQIPTSNQSYPPQVTSQVPEVNQNYPSQHHTTNQNYPPQMLRTNQNYPPQISGTNQNYPPQMSGTNQNFSSPIPRANQNYAYQESPYTPSPMSFNSVAPQVHNTATYSQAIGTLFNQPIRQHPAAYEPEIQSTFSSAPETKYPELISKASYGPQERTFTHYPYVSHFQSFTPPQQNINSYYSYNNVPQQTYVTPSQSEVGYNAPPKQEESQGSQTQLQTLFYSGTTSLESLPTNMSSQTLQPIRRETRNIDLLGDIDLSAAPPLTPLLPINYQQSNQELGKQQHHNERETTPMKEEEIVTEDEPIEDVSVLCRPEKVDPSSDVVFLLKLSHEVDKLANTIDSFDKKSLNGPTNLDIKWRDVLDLQNADSGRKSISVARCYPMKNRFPDILPFDQSRVPLPSTKDDYINASELGKLSAAALPLIITQLPLPSTYADFWHMVYNQDVELIVSLLSDDELQSHIYYPTTKGQDMEFPHLRISFQTMSRIQGTTQRVFSLTQTQMKVSRVVIQLQLRDWGPGIFPPTPAPLLAFLSQVHSFYDQQRNPRKPVAIHCLAGVGRSGVFAILSAAIREVMQGNMLLDLALCAGSACGKRKGILIDREYLRYAYHVLLYFCQDLLVKRGVSSMGNSSFEKPKTRHRRLPSTDYLDDTFKSLLPPLLTESVKKEAPLNPSPSHEGKGSEKEIGRLSTLSPVRSLPKLMADLPPDLTSLDPSTFRRKEKVESKAREAFESGKGALLQRKANEAQDDDPLSSLDPLWTINK